MQEKKNEGINGEKNPKSRDNKLNKRRHRKKIDKWKKYATDKKELKSKDRNQIKADVQRNCEKQQD